MKPLTFLTLSTTDWDAPQFGSRQAIARSLARRGHRVLFVEVPRTLHSLISDPAGTARALRRIGSRRVIAERLVAYTPLPLLPIYYHPWSNALNQRLLRRDLRRVLRSLGWQPDVLWTYWPNTAALCDSFGERLVVYHCIDDFTAVSYPLVRRGTIAAMEADLCRRADVVLASTEELAAAKGAFNSRTVHLRTGVDFDAFDPDRIADAEVSLSTPPRIGFVGTLDDRLDVDMIVDCAQRLPKMSFIFVGPVKRHRVSTAPLEAIPNVLLLPSRLHEEIPGVIAAFDVAIIPYRRTAFTENVAPAKLYEYLAMGKPTVTADLPFARRAQDLLWIAKDGEELAQTLLRIVEQPTAESDRRRWRTAAAANSWETRVDTVEAVIEPALASLHARATAREARTTVLQVVASSRGGGATHVRDVVAGLDPARFAVEVVMPDDGGHVCRRDFERLGIPLHALRLEAGVSSRALRELRRLITRFQVVHAHGARAALWTRSAALTLPSSRPRIVYTIHGFTAPFDAPWRRAALRLIEGALAPATNLYVAVCEAERDALAAARWCPSQRVAVVRNGVGLRRSSIDRLQVRARLHAPAAAILVTTVCRLDRPRDFETLLAAFRWTIGADASAHLLIVGDGPATDGIRRACSDSELSARVTLAGQRNDIEAILAASDVFVLTSTGGDGLPISILEAMAAGLPVVATATDGIPEAVVDGETGFLVEPGDPTSLGNALLRLVREPQTRQGFGAAGRAHVEQSFDVRGTVAVLADLYEQIVRRERIGKERGAALSSMAPDVKLRQ